MKRKRARLALIIIGVLAIGGIFYAFFRLRKPQGASLHVVVFTIAGSPLGEKSPRFEDPFGIAIAADGAIYVTDGDTGKLWEIQSNGSSRVVIDKLDTPSGISVSQDGSLVVAETGAHVVRRVHPRDGSSEVIAGIVGRSGFLDGGRAESLFNGPIGVAIGADGTIFVADTYNDRIRAIDVSGHTRTIAGGSEAAFVDSQTGTDARFNTPCGIALSPSGTLIVADTGNHRIRAIDSRGGVRTIAGSGERGNDDGLLFLSRFDEPVGIAVDKDGTIYVADSRSSTVRGCGWNLFPRVWTLAGEAGNGLLDGDIKQAKLHHPVGIALAPDGSLFITDNGNKVVRSIGGMANERGTRLDSRALSSLMPSASEIRLAAGPRWPFDPPSRPREIAATFGEIRGEVTESDKQAWFHNGLDIPGGYGETVRAVRSERVLNPISVADVGTSRERIRLPMLGYIHLRIGRDVSDRILDESKFVVQRDADARITMLRVRRGSWFEAGEPLGTLNNQNHVHLTIGPVGNEFNAIAALELPEIKDTVAPTIEPDGVRIFDSLWRELRVDGKDDRLTIAGKLRVVVHAYDQMDGNAARRRLGIYKLGYQLLTSDKQPVAGFAEPLMTISFESLPRDDTLAHIAYAAGSQSGATGETIFAYIVTNIVRDKEAREDYFSTQSLAPGDYLIRVIAEDFFGNRATRDIPVRIATP